jgi:tRNA dimethylallyltransferase
LEVLGDLRRRGKVPVLTAGTGLYLRALLEGLAEAPARSEELRARLRESVKRKSPEHLHRLLARVDPETAAKIAPRDTQKAIRAVEMRLLTKRSVGDIHRAGRGPLEGWDVVKIGLLPPRPALYARIDARVHAMIKAGWLDEVRGLIASGVPGDAKPFQFIGYSQLRDHLAGQLSLADAVARIQRATRQFAKRQITWFRKEPGVHWLHSFGDSREAWATSVPLREHLPGP